MAGQSPDTPAVQRPISSETAERRAVLDQAVASRDTGDRQAGDFCVVDPRSAATVATMLGLPNAQAVYNRVYRALGLLRERLERAGIRRGDL